MLILFLCVHRKADTYLPPPDFLETIQPIRTHQALQQELDACKQVYLTGVPTLQTVQGAHIYQVVEGQPHVLAFQGKRRLGAALRFTLTATEPTTSVQIFSTDSRTNFKPGTSPTEHHVVNDHCAPFYVIFNGLTGIHFLQVDAFFKNRDNKIISKRTKIRIQASRLDLKNHHEELIERFRYKLAYNIQQPLMCPVTPDPDSHLYDSWTRTLEYVNESPFGHVFNPAKLLESPIFRQDIFHPTTPKDAHLLAAALCLIERLGQSETVLRDIRSLMAHSMQYNLEPPLTPETAYECYKRINFPVQQSTISRPRSRTPSCVNVARDAFALTPSDLYPLVTANLTRTDSSTVFPGRTIKPDLDFKSDIQRAPERSPSPPPTWAQIMRSSRQMKFEK